MQANQDSILAAWENQNEFKKVVREKEGEEKKKGRNAEYSSQKNWEALLILTT